MFIKVQKKVQGGLPINHFGLRVRNSVRASSRSAAFEKSHGWPFALHVRRSMADRPLIFKFRLEVFAS